MRAGTNYLRASQKTLERVASTTAWRYTIRNRTFNPIYFVSPPLQISARRISTKSSKIRATTYASQAPLISLITLGTAVSLGTFLYRKSPVDKTKDESVVRLEGLPKGFVSGKGEEILDLSRGVYEVGEEKLLEISKLPRERAKLTSAPEVPPRIERDYPVLLEVPLTTTTEISQLTNAYKYEKWTFDGAVPGPFIRARVGDVVELKLTNKDESGNPHNIDSHAFTGPGGGAALTTTEENDTKTARFGLLYPGLYLYHCAAAPVPVHIANGMYGLMYVQPAEGDLPPVDREYYVMQSEFYHEPPEVEENGRPSSQVEFSYPNALREEPSVVVFNGNESALTRDKPLKAKVNETVRIFFGNAGPNLTSSFHVIGSHFLRVYRDGSVIDPPSRFVSTVGVPPGSAAITDLKMVVPGTYTLVDHALFRLDKGAVGFLNVSGQSRPDIYQSSEPAEPCVGCKLHS